MELSIAVADKNAPPNAFVVWRGFEESIDKAAGYGYGGIELALKDASQINAVALNKWLARAKISVSAITTGQVFAVSGLSFTHPEAAARAKIVEVFKGLADLAADFAPILNIGRARGYIEKNSDAAATCDLFFQSVLPVLEYCYKKNVTLVIEPVNRYETNFINSVYDCVMLLNDIPVNNSLRQFIGIMPDTFHMNIEDAKIGEALIQAGRLVKYVHLSDSNRLAPGSGHLDFGQVFDALADINYEGWVSVEIIPEPNPDEAAGKAASYLLPLVGAYNLK